MEKVDFLAEKYIHKYKEEISLKATLNKKRKGKKYIYLISNMVFAGWLKIGITDNIEKRIMSYQFNDPLRRFSVQFFAPVDNARLIEMVVCKIYNSKTEWIEEGDVDKVVRLINKLKERQ